MKSARSTLNPHDLLLQWQARADWLQQYGDPNSARLWRLAAVELERALEAFGAEALTDAEAAQGTGYSPGYIGKLIASGKVQNAGPKKPPRACGGDLKVKPQNGRGRPPRPAEQQAPKNITPITKLKRR